MIRDIFGNIVKIDEKKTAQRLILATAVGYSPTVISDAVHVHSCNYADETRS